MAGLSVEKIELGELSKIKTYHAAALQAAAARALRVHSDKILSPYGITKMQWVVIGMVLDAKEKGISVARISNALDITSASLAKLISTLIKNKMVVLKRTGKNGIHKLVTIHPEFAPDCPEIERVLRAALRTTVYAKITPLELRIYLKVMYQLSQI